MINRTKYILPITEYFPEPQEKDLVMLHFTAGSSAVGAFATFKTVPGKVGTSYIAERDAMVYEIFPPWAWAYHLGMTGNNPGYINDRRSIGIEIVNPGPLVRGGNTLKTTYGTAWCDIGETNKYVQCPTWRGYNFFATFPDGQYQSLIELVRALCAEFKIPKVIPPADKLTTFDPAFFGKWKGIASHQNFRSDKSDIGPAFDWARFEKGIAA